MYKILKAEKLAEKSGKEKGRIKTCLRLLEQKR